MELLLVKSRTCRWNYKVIHGLPEETTIFDPNIFDKFFIRKKDLSQKTDLLCFPPSVTSTSEIDSETSQRPRRPSRRRWQKCELPQPTLSHGDSADQHQLQRQGQRLFKHISSMKKHRFVNFIIVTKSRAFSERKVQLQNCYTIDVNIETGAWRSSYFPVHVDEKPLSFRVV